MFGAMLFGAMFGELFGKMLTSNEILLERPIAWKDRSEGLKAKVC